MELVNAFVGLIQLIIAILLSVVALYIGYSTFSRITKGMDEQQELMKGNVAVGIIIAAIFFAIALVIQSGVAGISVGIINALDGDWLALVASFIQLILGIILAIVAIYLALNVLDRLTKGVDEFAELKKGNVAVALMMAGVIGTIATYIHMGGKLGVMVEVNSETDFVAKNEQFLEFAKNVAMHIAASNPLGIRPEDVPFGPV